MTPVPAVIPDIPAVDEIPWKLVPTKQRVQFTCEFKELSLGARADLKAVKTLTAKVTPARLLVLHGAAADCDAVVQYAKSVGISEAHAPLNGQSISFSVLSERLEVQIPQSLLLPASMKPLRVYSSAKARLEDTKCTVSTLSGVAAESKVQAGQDGTRSSNTREWPQLLHRQNRR